MRSSSNSMVLLLSVFELKTSAVFKSNLNQREIQLFIHAFQLLRDEAEKYEMTKRRES